MAAAGRQHNSLTGTAAPGSALHLRGRSAPRQGVSITRNVSVSIKGTVISTGTSASYHGRKQDKPRGPATQQQRGEAGSASGADRAATLPRGQLSGLCSGGSLSDVSRPLVP